MWAVGKRRASCAHVTLTSVAFDRARLVCSVLWHCHLMHPRHYLTSCTSLLGTVDVIDHDPGYVSPKAIKGSDFSNKVVALYRFERGFYCQKRYSLYAVYGYNSNESLSGITGNQDLVIDFDTDDWLEAAFRNDDMYGDEADCG